MNDYTNIIQGSFGAARLAAVGDSEEDPEKAARAIQLGKATGLAPEVVHGDLDRFDQDYKRTLTGQLIESDSHLSDYVNSSPMAAKVSNDDWAPLSKISQAIQNMGQVSVMRKAVEAFKDEMSQHQMGDWLRNTEHEPTKEFIKNYPNLFAAMQPLIEGLGEVVELPATLFSAGLKGVQAGVQESFQQLGIDEGEAKRYARDITGLAEYQLFQTPGKGTGVPKFGEALEAGRGAKPLFDAAMIEAAQAVRPYVMAGKEPPLGLHPLIDKVIKDQSTRDLKALNDLFSEAQKSATRERAPELFQNFLEMRDNGLVGINAEVIAELYKNKAPHAEDGLLGWVLNLESQMGVALANGGDIIIPRAMLLARMEPEVFKELQDFIRPREGGVTKAEGEIAGKTALAKSEGEPFALQGLRDIAEQTTQEGIKQQIEALQPKTFEEYLLQKTQRIAEEEIVNSDVVWAKARELHQLRNERQGFETSFTQAFTDIANIPLKKHFGREITPQEIAQIGIQNAGIGVTKSVRAAASLPLDYGTGPKKGWNWTPAKGPATIFHGDRSFTLKPLAESTVQQALKSISLEDLNLFLREHTIALAAKIIESAGDVPIYLVSNKIFKEMTGKNEGQIAFYSYDTVGKAQDHIVVPTSTFYNTAKFNRAVLHESIHAATSRALEARPELLQDARSIIREIKEQHPDWKDYGLSDPHELLTEALSNKAFQEDLSKIQISEELAQQLGMKEWRDTSVWKAIIDWVRRTLNLDENSFSALEAVMRVTEEAAEERGALPEQKTRVTKGAERQGELPGITRQEDLQIFQTITGFMNKKQRDFYMEKIAERNGKDAEFRAQQVDKQLRKEMTAEWKAEAKQVREAVLDDLHQRPDIAALEFFRSGKLYGEETGTRPRVDPKSLTPEQLAAFPEKYLRRDGMDGADVAQLLGFSTVKEMGTRVREMDDAVGKGSFPSLLEKLATGETERRMRAKHGDLDENILAEAQDHVIAAPQMDMLHEEVHALGMKTGSEMSFSKADFKSWAKVKINSLPADSVSMEKFFRDSGKAGREYELAMLSEDWNQAFKSKQQQYLSLLLADEAKKFEKKQEQLEGNLKRYRKAQVPGIAPEHLNYVHDIMQRIGAPVERSTEHVAEGIGQHGFGTLEEFYKYRNQIGLPDEFKEYNVDYTPSMPVADFLFDPAFHKKLEAMSVGEVAGIADSLKALIKNGREEAKFIRQGEAFDLAQLKGDMIDQLRTLGEKPLYKPEQAGPLGKVKHFVSRGFAGLLQMEALWDRFDHGDPRGLFTKNIAHPFADAGSYYSTLQRQFSKMLTEIQKMDKSLKEGVPSGPIIDPHTIDFEPRPRIMNRENLRTVILNMGTNFEKMAKGHGVDPVALHNWVLQHATKEDWEYAKGMWGLFKEIKKLEDAMTHELSGVTIEDLPGRIIQTPFGDYEAGYFPMRYDRSVGAGPKVDIENELAFFRPMTSHGWEKKRTGYAGPIDLTLGSVPQEILRRLKDLAFRPVIIEASKIMLDKQFKSSVTRYYGGPFSDLMLPYLKDMAGQAGITAANMDAIGKVGESIRQNTIGVLVGWNPGTVIKHGLSAWSNSMAEVGISPFLEWFGKTWADPSMKNYKFVMEGGQIGNLEWKGSAEVQRRMQHFEETLGGAHDIVMGKPSIRQKALQWGSRPVAISDMASTIPTWLAQYDTTMRESMKTMPVEQAHTDAVTLADRSVRNAHGSTAITSRPEFMRGSTLSKGVTSLYGFFNHVFNRYYQMAWRSKEMLEKAGRGDPIKQDVADLSNRFMLYMVGPILAEGVAELALKKDESWPEWLWHSAAHTITGTIPILRDITHAALGGRDPSTGIWGAGGKALTDFVRDFGHKKKTEAGAIIQHGITLAGIATGVGSAQIGKWGRFMADYTQRKSVPRGEGDVYRAFRRGRIERYK